MRPASLAEFEEQASIIGQGTLLRRAIEADLLKSMLFFGPPGSGKTALANIIAGMTRAHFEVINAVTAGLAEIRRVIEKAKERQSLSGKKTVLFIDEIHRFNRVQQEALLPFVEKGLIILIGSTTENPMFYVSRPLLSRLQVYRLEPLSKEAVKRILERALKDSERGLAKYQPEIEDQALNHLAAIANGDARMALNALELAVLLTKPDQDGKRRINLSTAEQAIQQRVLQYGKKEEHYDVVSAWIKSMRGSDPQAALYWLARLIYAGETPEFICRRLMIHAAEDVGLADPQALILTTAAAQAVERVGYPEARLILAEAVLYIALAPKSNSVYQGIEAAYEAVKKEKAEEVPPPLRDASYKGAAMLGHGKGYKYPHDYPGHWVAQEYLPPSLKGQLFYQPSRQGKEKLIYEQWLKRISVKQTT
ncbi:MAG TPA: AAA family ATPase [Desulfotomaculum sp.]|nr:AAA family ATPase [Desulfotomaculum sp.]